MIFYYRRLLTVLYLIKLMKLKTFIQAKLILNLKLHVVGKKPPRKWESKCIVLVEHDNHFREGTEIN